MTASRPPVVQRFARPYKTAAGLGLIAGVASDATLVLGLPTRVGYQHAIQRPAAGDTLQLVLTAFLEEELRAGDEILDRLGDEDFVRIRARRDAGTD